MMFPKNPRIVNKEVLVEYAKSHPRCEIPGCRFKTMDMPHHIIFKSHINGHDVPSNLISLCQHHHNEAHGKHPKEWKIAFQKIKEGELK